MPLLISVHATSGSILSNPFNPHATRTLGRARQLHTTLVPSEALPLYLCHGEALAACWRADRCWLSKTCGSEPVSAAA